MFSKNIKLENFKNPKIQKNLKNYFKSLIKKKMIKKISLIVSQNLIHIHLIKTK